MRNITCSEYRRIGAEKCKPFEGALVGIILVSGLINGLISSIGNILTTQEEFEINGTIYLVNVSNPFFSTLSSVLSLIITPILALAMISIIKGLFLGKKPQVKDLFSEFNSRGFGYIIVNLLVGLFTILWSLLLIIPGIIACYSYSMAGYIYEEDSSLSGTEPLARSKELMKGHKMELFLLHLSYIGWLFLCILTFGILILWVAPRIEAAQYAFYLNITDRDPESLQSSSENVSYSVSQ